MRLLLFLVLLAAMAVAAAPARPWLVVPAEDDVLFIDPQELKVVRTVEDFDKPQHVAVSADHRWLAACRRDHDAVQVCELEGKAKVQTLEGPTLQGPSGLHLSADGKRLWILSAHLKALVEMDPAFGKVLRVLALEGPEPTGLLARPDGRTLLVTSPAGTLAEVDLQSFSVVRHDTLASRIRCAGWLGFDRLLVGLDAPQVKVLDAGRDRPLAVSLPAPALAVAAPGVALTAENLVRFDTVTGETAWQIAVASQPVGLATTPDHRWAFVAAAESRDLQVVDLLTGAEKTRLSLQRSPAGVLWVP